MVWIMDTYSMNKGYSVLGVVTGKPIEIGGSRGKLETTGRGYVICARLASKQLGINLEEATIAVQVACPPKTSPGKMLDLGLIRKGVYL